MVMKHMRVQTPGFPHKQWEAQSIPMFPDP